MTAIVGTASGATNVFDSGSLEGLAATPLGAHSSTQFTISDSDFQVTGFGTGLSYSGGHPSGGTITSLTVDAFGFTSTWSGFSISTSTLWHAVSTGDINTFNSLLFGGNDTFTSGATGGSTDNVAGYAGDDVFNMGASFKSGDHIDGGTGNDTVNLNGDYSADLQFFSDSIVSVENITVSAGHDYVLTLSNGATPLSGTLKIDASALGAGNFLNFDGGNVSTAAFNVTGGAGDDIFRGGGGNDTFNGGGGNDVVSYFSSSSAMTINIGTTGPQNIGPGFGTDTLISVEGVITGSGNDTITGDSHDNFIDAGGGSNVIDGGAGNDTVSFANTAGPISIDLSLNTQSVNHNDGTDTVTSVESVVGTAQNDMFIAGNNDNVIDGGFGGQLNDTLSYIHATAGVVIDFSAGTGVGNVTGGSGHDTISDIGHIIGSSFGDTLIVGLDPHNLSGGLLPQSFDGGDGDDTVDFSHLGAGVDMNQPFEAPTLTSVETIIGTSFDDVLNASFEPVGSVSTVEGGDGNDTLMGTNGAADLIGGAGNDTLITDNFNAADTMDGGTGNDILYFSNISDPGVTTFAPTTMVSVETLLLERVFANGIKTDDANVAAGATLTVGFSSDNSWVSAGAVTFDGSAETNGNFNITTLEGYDAITGGAGNDVISTGSGNDTIDISFGGNDIVHAGDDNDTILAGAALTAADRIDGGNGTDTLTLNGDYSAGLIFAPTTMVNIETLQLAGGHSYKLTPNDASVAAGQTLSVDASALTAGNALTFIGSHETDGAFAVTGGAGNDLIVGGKGNDTLGGGAGNDVFNGALGDDTFAGGDGNDTFNVGADLTATDRIDGGTGNDTVVLAGDYSASLTFGATTMVNVETLQLAAGHSYTLIMNDANVAAGQTLTVNGTALTAANALSCDGSQESDGSFAFIGGLGNDVLTGGAGGDSFNLSRGGNDSAAGGAGNDTFILGATLTAADIIDGGAGHDTVVLNGNYAPGVTLGATTITNVETIALAAGHSYALTTDNATVAAGTTMGVDASLLDAANFVALHGAAETDGAFSVTGGAGNDTIQTGAGNDAIDLSHGGNDAVSAGGGTDILTLGAAFTASDRLDGGAGSDTVILNGDYAAGVVFIAATMVNVETIRLTAGHSYNLLTQDANLAAGAALTVNGTTLGAGDSLTFNGSHEKDGAFVINSGGGNDTLTGGSGNDAIYGGLGSDHLNGGGGSDRFVFHAAAESTGAAFDTITGFDATADAFDLPYGVAGINAAVAGGALSSATFDSDLAAAVGSGQLGVHHALLFTPNSGDFAGDTFLIVDSNKVAGYQAGQDYVFQLDHPANLASLGVGDFV